MRGERIATGLADMTRQGFHLDRESIEAIAAEEARRNRSGRIALWIAALSLAAIAVGVWW